MRRSGDGQDVRAENRSCVFCILAIPGRIHPGVQGCTGRVYVHGCTGRKLLLRFLHTHHPWCNIPRAHGCAGAAMVRMYGQKTAPAFSAYWPSLAVYTLVCRDAREGCMFSNVICKKHHWTIYDFCTRIMSFCRKFPQTQNL